MAKDKTIRLTSGHHLDWDGENHYLKLSYSVDQHSEMGFWVSEEDLESLKTFISGIKWIENNE